MRLKNIDLTKCIVFDADEVIALATLYRYDVISRMGILPNNDRLVMR